MLLSDLIKKYLVLAGSYGKSVPISALGYSRAETEKAFDALDEDYHISRFFHFRNEGGEEYQINGFPQTHISIESEIQSIL